MIAALTQWLDTSPAFATFSVSGPSEPTHFLLVAAHETTTLLLLLLYCGIQFALNTIQHKHNTVLEQPPCWPSLLLPVCNQYTRINQLFKALTQWWLRTGASLSSTYFLMPTHFVFIIACLLHPWTNHLVTTGYCIDPVSPPHPQISNPSPGLSLGLFLLFWLPWIAFQPRYLLF